MSYRIIAVCGFGVGSSMLLKIKLSKAFEEANVAAEVSTSDVTSAPSESVDAIFTSKELAETLSSKAKCPVISIDSFVNQKEITEKVQAFIDKNPR